MAHDAEERGLVPGEVLELLEERSKVESWVDKLSGLESEASPAVYGKVLTDYRERLEKLADRLASHRSTVQTSLDGVRERLARLAQERAERVAALEEAKLRFTVGEYAEKEWERHREGDGRAVADLEERLGVENEARQELERILSELPGAPDRSGHPTPWAPSGEGEIPPRLRGEGEGENAGLAAATPAAAYVVEPGDDDPSTGENEKVQGDLTEIAPEPTAEIAPEPTAEIAPEPTAETAPEPTVEPTPATDRLAARPVDAFEGESVERGPPATGPVTGREGASMVDKPSAEEGSYLDELAFLESLTLEDTERFDAVSAMLEESEENGENDDEERPH